MNELATKSTDIMPIIGQMDGLMYLSDTLVKSGMLPAAIKTKEAALVIILKARELGIGTLEGFSSINVIQGKPTISPQLMLALAERSGHLQDYQITDDGNTCTVTVKRRGRSPFSASFSMANAIEMGLDTKENWKKQAKVMRQWRAISAAFRVVFADVLAGLSTPEEMGSDVDDDGRIIVEPAKVDIGNAVSHQAEAASPTNGNGHTPKPWIETAEGVRSHPWFDETKEIVGEETYYEIFERHGFEHRTDLTTKAQAKTVIDDLKKARLDVESTEPQMSLADMAKAVDAQP